MCHDLPPLHLRRRLLHRASFPDTPIYDSLVAERGTPQIAPIRVPCRVRHRARAICRRCPRRCPRCPAAPSAASYGAYGYPQAQQPAPLQQAPGAVHPAAGRRRAAIRARRRSSSRVPPAPAGYEAMRPAAPRPAAPQYQDPYNNQQYRGY